ncbi:MAG: hypothetical protein QOE25_690, partial [Actinomycetota bacterium]|nr:hypothetical protein [Actinomycetota bacterium]
MGDPAVPVYPVNAFSRWLKSQVFWTIPEQS